MDRPPVVAVTAGEPAGIGPDLCVSLEPVADAQLVIVGDRYVLAQRARQLGVPFDWPDFDPRRRPGAPITVWHHPVAVDCTPGTLDTRNVRHVLDVIDDAVDACLARMCDAVVTAPVHKGVINQAGISFSGHTEYLQEKTRSPQVVMMLVGGGLRVALATTHLPLSRVPAAITRERLGAVLEVLDGDLRRRFGLERPRILVAGLNPHAGESGHLGHEEIEIIEPVMDSFRARGLHLIGPLPADTLFTPAQLARGDCVLAMYHDQGLPVLKMHSFGRGVNVTLGMPIVRTSVDHGTALDLAGTGRIDRGSMAAAIELAIGLTGAV
jgi:4-hydroxythreonine-4-phosphate dehydrogenase